VDERRRDVEAAIRTFDLALEATDDPILLARTHVALNYSVDIEAAIRHCEAALSLLEGEGAPPELKAEALAALARTTSAWIYELGVGAIGRDLLRRGR
jgi:hypothetical protein